MLFFVWLEFNDAQTQNSFNEMEVFLFHLSLRRMGSLI